jgi:hypothetical protein
MKKLKTTVKKTKCCMKNEGKADRIVRLIVGLVFIVLGYMYSPWLYIIAAIALLTAATGFCCAYKIFGINTKK